MPSASTNRVGTVSFVYVLIPVLLREVCGSRTGTTWNDRGITIPTRPAPSTELTRQGPTISWRFGLFLTFIAIQGTQKTCCAEEETQSCKREVTRGVLIGG